MKKFKLSYKHILLLVPWILIASLLAQLFIPMIYNPMQRPASMIRNHVLRQTPIGTCIEEVIEIVENNERWGESRVNRESGFSYFGPDFRDWPVCELTGARIVGNQSIRTSERYRIRTLSFVSLGQLNYRQIRIYWGFDEDGKLIEVYVDSFYGF